MNKTNLDIIEVNAYYEMAIVSSKKMPLKIAVLKVRYSDGSWKTIFRCLMNHRLSNINNYVEEYQGIELGQIRQLSNIISEDEQKIFELYFKKYLKNDLNINTSITENILKLYIEDKKQYVLTKTKNILQKVRTFEKQFFMKKLDTKSVYLDY